MQNQRPTFSFVAIGEQSLLIQCGDALLARGHELRAVIAQNVRIVQWCAERAIPCLSGLDEIERRIPEPFDVLLSITNLRMLPEWLIARPRTLAANFHDGPLPKYAGLNVPAWAILNGESTHGITWHVMAAAADTGPILLQRRFPIAADDTAFSLNARCYEEGAAAFVELLDGLEAGSLQPTPQDPALRSYFGAARRPDAAATLDWRQPAVVAARLVRGLDFGRYPNPLLLPKVDFGTVLLLARRAEVVAGTAEARPGVVQSCSSDSLTVRCVEDALRIDGLTDLQGRPVDVAAVLRQAGAGVGEQLPLLASEIAAAITQRISTLCRFEGRLRDRLRRAQPLDLPFAIASRNVGKEWRSLEGRKGTLGGMLGSLCICLARLTGKSQVSVGYVSSASSMEQPWFVRYAETVLPLVVEVNPTDRAEAIVRSVSASMAEAEQAVGLLNDLRARDPELRASVLPEDWPIRIVRVPKLDQRHVERLAGVSALTIAVTDDGQSVGFLANRSRIDDRTLDIVVDGVAALHAAVVCDAATLAGDLDLLSPADRQSVAQWAGSATIEDASATTTGTIHDLFEQQVRRTPDRLACIVCDESISYRMLNEAANRLARHLQSRGVRRGDRVGVMVDRSIAMMVALYATLKAGAAYVPLDPSYPASRLAYMASDAALSCIVTQRAYGSIVGAADPIVLDDMAAALADYPADDLAVAVQASDLAYLIYTSGSTGKPKGVMVEHRNVANFFAGMDQCLDTEPGVWLAVTSISFDISVLELFWTLARGFTVVLYADAARHSPTPVSLARRMEFGFFYWNVAGEDGQDAPDKYRLLLESAKFADTHDFNAVWTPERHFESFGGLFPNPSVISAALAVLTTRVALRAGSCVVPLHSPIRIAEEWAVVDNLSNGRVGISIAAGWAPPDFAIRPENFSEAKRIMFESAEIVQRLWRGEQVAFPGPKGPVNVRTLPRPLQPQLPLWVTTAGNVETFVEAGRRGANLLTHLLGQTVEEVAKKVASYRAAWREAGHDGRGVVTLMLHTLVGPDASAVEATVKGPMKEYLRSAAFLVKAAAWQFPTFKKLSDEQGHTLDQFFATISDEDMDALLEFSFNRYFQTSGLFGNVERCLEMVRSVELADVDEIACLIDFGVETNVVLAHLPYLNELRAAAQSAVGKTPVQRYDLPELLARHQVTHFQCTPSMAAMLVGDREAHPGLAHLKHMMVGGEALSPSLARELKTAVGGRLTNMYGPTETTVWSATADVGAASLSSSSVSIGRPLPNQTVHILDARQQPVPPGVTGEIVIGGAGVVRGYWGREALTAERFVPDTLSRPAGGRMYRTGDLGRYLPDGRLECLGRVDQQVKIRGHRVELGEIEALLQAHPQLRQAAVVLREDVPGDQRLVGYVSERPGQACDDDSLKMWLRQQLPDFMIPAAFVRLSQLPLTPNGKVDRQSLPAAVAPPLAPRVVAQPASAAELMIQDIWQRVLGVPHCGTKDNFFDIGGHSLLVVQVLSELREKVEKPIQLTDVFKYPTIEALARFVSGSQDSSTAMNRAVNRGEARRAAMARRSH